MTALSKLEHLAFDKREREIYEAERKARMDDMEELRTATEKGLNKGLAQGRQEWRDEERIGMARNLLVEGVAVDVIARNFWIFH